MSRSCDQNCFLVKIILFFKPGEKVSLNIQVNTIQTNFQNQQLLAVCSNRKYNTWGLRHTICSWTDFGCLCKNKIKYVNADVKGIKLKVISYKRIICKGIKKMAHISSLSIWIRNRLLKWGRIIQNGVLLSCFFWDTHYFFLMNKWYFDACLLFHDVLFSIALGKQNLSHTSPHVTLVPVKCHVWLQQYFYLSLRNRKNVPNKKSFCTILVGYLIILFKEVIRKTNCLMYA